MKTYKVHYIANGFARWSKVDVEGDTILSRAIIAGQYDRHNYELCDEDYLWRIFATRFDVLMIEPLDKRR